MYHPPSPPPPPTVHILSYIVDLKEIVKLSFHYQWNSSLIDLILIKMYKSFTP
jgi:hypothetical protein